MDLKEIEKKLSAEKEQLIKELDYYKKEDPYLLPDRATTNTVDDDITETEGHDRIVATRLNLKQRLSEVEGALLRIEEGKYGTCKKCGKEISEERLKAMPTAAYHVGCEGKVRR
ncbi:MAG: TraR/DksA C4-type zinc finger protein [Candidatus Woykebacteria bacterium]